jgi:hypothetical protein
MTIAGAARPTPFRSFWQAGFESACHVNRAGVRLDLLAATQHDRLAAEDYRRLKEFDIRTVREAVRWHLVDRGGRYDFSSVRPFAEAALREDVQVVWTLCHYGWPDGLELLDTRFVDRFAAYARATARYLADQGSAHPLCFAPVNEISFVAWAAGARGIMHPFTSVPAPQVKRQLVRATIAGIEAIRDVVPDARFLQVDPLVHIVAPIGRPELAAAARAASWAQFETLELLCGALEPTLGGDPRYLDILGLNYYHANQWQLGGERLRWEDHPRDQRWIPLHELLGWVWRSFRRPLVLAETSHFGSGRAAWIREVVSEVRAALEAGVPVDGVCLYPVIDRPDWDDSHHWHNSGLWDLRVATDGTLERVLCEEYARALRAACNGIPVRADGTGADASSRGGGLRDRGTLRDITGQCVAERREQATPAAGERTICGPPCGPSELVGGACDDPSRVEAETIGREAGELRPARGTRVRHVPQPGGAVDQEIESDIHQVRDVRG